MTEGERWVATLTVRTRGEPFATILERALRPEADREVPRASARIRRSSPAAVELAVSARDTGAMRAALNTYLGWIQLSAETARSARRSDVAHPG